MTTDSSGTTGLAADFARLEREWADAVMRQDRAVLDRLLAADFALVISAAPDRAVPRATWLDQALGPYRVRSAQLTGLAVRQVADGLATVSLLLSMEASVGGVERSSTFFIVDVWRRAGRLAGRRPLLIPARGGVGEQPRRHRRVTARSTRPAAAASVIGREVLFGGRPAAQALAFFRAHLARSGPDR